MLVRRGLSGRPHAFLRYGSSIGWTHRLRRLGYTYKNKLSHEDEANSILSRGRRMSANHQYDESLIAQGESHRMSDPTTAAPTLEAGALPLKMGIGQKAVVVVILTVVLIPPLGGVLQLLFRHAAAPSGGSSKEAEKAEDAVRPTERLAGPGATPHSAGSGGGPRRSGIRKGAHDAVAVAWLPKTMRPLVLPGSTAFDPTRLARIRAWFAPARVVQLAQVWDYSRKTGQTEYRELRPGDSVSKGDLLGVFYSVDVGSKKNDLLQALVRLELDQAS